jgi:precorrin-2 dehydrogenase/sirohydrochlorin ferrochelatase
MAYLPIFLDLHEKRCLVVGGGAVAERKVASMLEADAAVIVVSPALSEMLQTLAVQGRIVHKAREYSAMDLNGVALVFAATDDPALQRKVAADAAERSIPVNVADMPELCSFITPAVIRRGRLQLAVSTGGASPALAARIRRELEDEFGPEYAVGLEVLAAARAWLRPREPNHSERARKLTALAESELVELISAHDTHAVDRLLRRCLGADASIDALGLDGLVPDGIHAHPRTG